MTSVADIAWDTMTELQPLRPPVSAAVLVRAPGQTQGVVIADAPAYEVAVLETWLQASAQVVLGHDERLRQVAQAHGVVAVVDGRARRWSARVLQCVTDWWDSAEGTRVLRAQWQLLPTAGPS